MEGHTFKNVCAAQIGTSWGIKKKKRTQIQMARTRGWIGKSWGRQGEYDQNMQKVHIKLINICFKNHNRCKYNTYNHFACMGWEYRAVVENLPNLHSPLGSK